MIALIDTIFNPVIGWLDSIRSILLKASVPSQYRLPIGNYLRHFALLGPGWMAFIGSLVVLSAIYGYVYVASSGIGLFERFKNIIKWW